MCCHTFPVLSSACTQVWCASPCKQKFSEKIWKPDKIFLFYLSGTANLIFLCSRCSIWEWVSCQFFQSLKAKGITSLADLTARGTVVIPPALARLGLLCYWGYDRVLFSYCLPTLMSAMRRKPPNRTVSSSLGKHDINTFTCINNNYSINNNYRRKGSAFTYKLTTHSLGKFCLYLDRLT